MNTRSARNVFEFTHVVAQDRFGKPYTVVVPGHEGRRYFVYLTRDAGAINTRCQKEDGGNCPGSTYNVCYHSIAAVMRAAAVARRKVAVCGDEATAHRVAKLHKGATVVKVIANPSGKAWFAVTWNGRA